jgi:DNA-directed RNA polymerase specialized sigma24 family protein
MKSEPETTSELNRTSKDEAAQSHEQDKKKPGESRASFFIDRKDDAVAQLFRKYDRLFASIAAKCCLRCSLPIEYYAADLVQDAYLNSRLLIESVLQENRDAASKDAHAINIMSLSITHRAIDQSRSRKLAIQLDGDCLTAALDISNVDDNDLARMFQGVEHKVRLNDRQKDLLTFRISKKMTFRQIAQVLEIPEETAKKQWQRLLDAIQLLLLRKPTVPVSISTSK